MRAVILGGTFNPVHYGHLFIAEEARVSLGYDLAILLPANQPVHKDPSPVLAAHHRLEMLRRAVAGQDGLVVDTCDIDRGGPTYSIDAIGILKDRYGIKDAPGFLIGDDLAGGFPAWKNVDALARIVELVVARRTSDGPVTLAYPHRTIDNAVLPISSSEIRARIASGRTVRYLLPDRVLDYIRDNRLYV